MKVSKPDIKYIGQLIFTWTFLNLALNMIGLFITKVLNKAEYSPLDSVTNEFVVPVIIQFLLFGICLTAAVIWMKNKKYVPYVFAFFQVIIFHLIFILNLKIHHGLHFESTFNNIGLKYLSNAGQYLIDILYLYFPINGNFDNGLFQPDNLGTFYIHWILLNIVYYFAITWISIRIMKYILEFKVKALPKQKEFEEVD